MAPINGVGSTSKKRVSTPGPRASKGKEMGSKLGVNQSIQDPSKKLASQAPTSTVSTAACPSWKQVILGNAWVLLQWIITLGLIVAVIAHFTVGLPPVPACVYDWIDVARERLPSLSLVFDQSYLQEKWSIASAESARFFSEATVYSKHFGQLALVWCQNAIHELAAMSWSDVTALRWEKIGLASVTGISVCIALCGLKNLICKRRVKTA